MNIQNKLNISYPNCDWCGNPDSDFSDSSHDFYHEECYELMMMAKHDAEEDDS